MSVPDVDSSTATGDLRVEFKILFPQHLSDTQKKLIKSGLYYPSKPSPEQQTAVRAYLAAFTHDTHGWSTSFS
jgi:DnaJ-class molecular chaperone